MLHLNARFGANNKSAKSPMRLPHLGDGQRARQVSELPRKQTFNLLTDNRMEDLVLPTFRTTSSWPTRVGLAVLFSAGTVNLWTHIVHYPNMHELIFIVSISIVVIGVGMSLTRTTVINMQKKSATTETSLLGRRFKSKRVDLSTCAWVRARKTSSKLDTITVEIGTVGYMTTPLMILPDGSEENISNAEEWCERIASGLGIQSKGYRIQW